MLSLDVSFQPSGPLMDGSAILALDDFLRHARMEVAGQASAGVHTTLNRRIVHPTPYYETQINIRHEFAQSVVNDRGVIYGPWLEGTSSRNQTTRFKGYAAFRKATQAVGRRISELVEPILARYIGRM